LQTAALGGFLKTLETFKITKIKGSSREIVDDSVAEEVPFTVVVDGEELVTLLCSPSELEDLAVGFLFTAGLIKRAGDLKGIIINPEQWTVYVELINADILKNLVFKRLYTSGCGRGTLFYNTADIINRAKISSNFKIEEMDIKQLMTDFQKKSEGYFKTGGTHSAALADKRDILIFKEDIGRHNAIDKVIGCALRQEVDFANKILISSGRISSEVLLKARKCPVAVVISQSAPTNQAVRLAREMEMTLVGFARGERMNIYSSAERVVL